MRTVYPLLCAFRPLPSGLRSRDALQSGHTRMSSKSLLSAMVELTSLSRVGNMMRSVRVAIAADHAGFELKNELGEVIRRLGHEVNDVGRMRTTPRMTILILRNSPQTPLCPPAQNARF